MPQRPLGITIIAIVAAAGGLLSLFGGASRLAGMGTGPIALAYIVIVFGILGLALGAGFFSGARWAWMAGIIIYVISIGLGISEILYGGKVGLFGGISISIVMIVIPAPPHDARPSHSRSNHYGVFSRHYRFLIVQVALPTIRTQFLATLADSQWIIGAYGLTLAGFLMLMGRAGDVYGQKKIFIGGIVLFTIASMAGGLAPSPLVLIIFRAPQGNGGAISTVKPFAIFIRIFPQGPQMERALRGLAAVPS